MVIDSRQLVFYPNTNTFHGDLGTINSAALTQAAFAHENVGIDSARTRVIVDFKFANCGSDGVFCWAGTHDGIGYVLLLASNSL